MAQNVLILHCHDLGRFLGSYGIDSVSTPNLDALAEQSVLFEQAFATAPHCSPARASLFTGTYPQQNGMLGLAHEPFGWDLLDPSAHLAHRLQEKGYSTELVGVHHESKVLPDDQVAARIGFDRFRSGGDCDLVSSRAIDALERAALDKQPFYLQVGFHEPHRTASDRDRRGVMGFLGGLAEPDTDLGISVPAYLHDDAGAREEIAELQGAVKLLDTGVGRVLARLEQLGLAEQTIVVFTTDHGLALPRAKCTLYDAGLEVALMIRAPRQPLWPGCRVPGQVSHVDVLPTLFELLDFDIPEAVAGDSLVDVVQGQREGRQYTFGQLSHHTYYDPKRSVRSDTHKCIVNFSNAPVAMDPTQSWVHRSLPADLAGPSLGTSPVMELYDLVNDPHERNNIASDPAGNGVLAPLAAALLAWMHQTGDVLLNPAPGHRRQTQALAVLECANEPRLFDEAKHPVTNEGPGIPTKERELA